MLLECLSAVGTDAVLGAVGVPARNVGPTSAPPDVIAGTTELTVGCARLRCVCCERKLPRESTLLEDDALKADGSRRFRRQVETKGAIVAGSPGLHVRLAYKRCSACKAVGSLDVLHFHDHAEVRETQGTDPRPRITRYYFSADFDKPEGYVSLSSDLLMPANLLNTYDAIMVHGASSHFSTLR